MNTPNVSISCSYYGDWRVGKHTVVRPSNMIFMGIITRCDVDFSEETKNYVDVIKDDLSFTDVRGKFVDVNTCRKHRLNCHARCHRVYENHRDAIMFAHEFYDDLLENLETRIQLITKSNSNLDVSGLLDEYAYLSDRAINDDEYSTQIVFGKDGVSPHINWSRIER